MSDYTTNDCGGVDYPNGFTWHCEDMGCAFVARDWHGGQATYLYAFQCGDFSPETVVGAANELSHAMGYDDDPSIRDMSALEDLQRWADGVASLVTQ